MAYTVTITYVAPTAPVDGTLAVGAGIGALWNPESYVDGVGLDGTVYDTNKPGFGTIPLPEPFATTSFPLGSPLAQFKVATAVASGINSFSVPSFEEAIYFAQTGKDLKSQGFTVTVEEDAPSV